MFWRKRFDKNLILSAAVNFLKNEGFLRREIKAALGRYERPGLIHGKEVEEAYYPSIVVNHNNKETIFDIDLDGKGKMKKWRVFSNHAKSRDGDFFVITPLRKAKKAKKLLRKKNIPAEVVELI